MRRERTNLFPCRKTKFCDTLKRGECKFSAFQIVAKVYEAFRAKPEFNKNLKNPGTCATDFSPIDSQVSKSGAFWHEARAHESVSVS